ncbi:MAG: hypothetical protein M1327_01765 [Candidatus Thermoplasmatota archaeon]|nr:hypothetical protein [Candidatus Thermoplasmatota archaeon]
MLPASVAASPGNSVSVSTGSSPSVTIGLPHGDQLNFSYSYLLLYAEVDSSGLFGMFEHTILFGADLKNVNWKILVKDDTTYFNASFPLVPTTLRPIGFDQNLTNLTIPRNLPGFNITPEVEFSVQISIDKNVSPVLYAYNTTDSKNAANFTNLTISTLRIDNYITISKMPIPAIPYNIVLLQSLNATINHTRGNFIGFNANAQNFQDNRFDGFAIGSSDMIDHSRGLFWWLPNYTSNGETFPLHYSFLRTYGALYLVFQYHGISSGTTIVQDPYLSVINETINGLKIINQEIHIAYEVLLHNIELVSTGSIIGLFLVGVAYTSYRSKRF